MFKLFDFILSVTAVIALLVASYLFATDSSVLKTGNEVSLKPTEDISKTTPNGPAQTHWKYIIIHHSSTKNGNARIFDHYHREEMKITGGLAYHFVIGNGTKSANGEVESGERWQGKIPGPHTFDAQMNEQSIGICLVGDFQKDKPTPAQLNALVDLIKKLQKDYQIPTDHVLGHNEVDKGKTDCPGKNLPWQELKNRLK